MAEALYHNEGVVASYPYVFEIFEEDGKKYGVATCFVYDGLNVPEAEKAALEERLSAIPCQAQSGYHLEGDRIIYRTQKDVERYPNEYASDVGVRRHFIEDFIETDEDLAEIVKAYNPHTLKTEFVI